MLSILSGWASAAVIADLIAQRWSDGRVFCLAIGFLFGLFAVASVSGVVLLLWRRHVGRHLLVFGSAVALLTFGALFAADTEIARPAYLIPLLPLAALGLAVHPATRTWCGN